MFYAVYVCVLCVVLCGRLLAKQCPILSSPSPNISAAYTINCHCNRVNSSHLCLLYVQQIMEDVAYPLEITVPERYMSPDLAETSRRVDFANAQYELASVILHHGDKAASGHYSTLCREVSTVGPTAEKDDKECSGTDTAASSSVWRSFNDTKVALITEQQVVTANQQVIAYNVVLIVGV